MTKVDTSHTDVLEHFHSCTRTWFCEAFPTPTRVQAQAWPRLAAGKSTLLLAPTGSGKTLAAFLSAIDRLMFDASTRQEPSRGVRVLYISPLKALGVDVDRNLRAPIAGLRAVANRAGAESQVPRVGVRSGDTPADERRRMARHAPDILITTPESLYLLLTSKTRETLANLETVIIDEIHAMAATKRGSHLFVSLERLEHLRRAAGHDKPVQRVGLSATQRPLEEIARLLGGAEANVTGEPIPRPVEIVDASEPKQFSITVEVPVEDMTIPQTGVAQDNRPRDNSPPLSAADGLPPPSIWPAIHPRLVALIRQHRSTMIFVNSRRLAERLSTAINELAEAEIALAHHGSIAKDQRALIEDRLKRGDLPAIVATSSLELGIDMGAVDLVIQIEAPPSIAAGVQRIGRAGHQVGTPSVGVIFPKFRGDLLACSAATRQMSAGYVEETRYPRNPLDVLAQQIVAMVAMDPLSVDEAFTITRAAAPFHDLPRSSFEGVLDLLSGRYPSNEFSELRPRINWDRVSGELTPRKGTQRIAILNGGTIPDRGLYGVFLVGEAGAPGSRVGELDEEMVFETQPGDVFLLGASSWRVVEITRDRVMVTPAPGEPGRMPFWRGDGPGRPLEFGRAIGQLARELVRGNAGEAVTRLNSDHGLDALAAKNLMNYLREQAAATGEPPSDKTIIVESFLDEIGDWRVVILSPFGARVHAPWALAVSARLRAELGSDVDMMWSDDGIVLRLPQSDGVPDLDLLIPASEDIEQQVTNHLGSTALFAARFRENAARALLLPRQQPGRRTPLWLQRRRSADLLAVAARYPAFPMLLETYRECLRDVFDLTGLRGLLRQIERREIGVRTVQTSVASPFAAAQLFSYTANFLYEGDSPLAERRAAALSLDHTQLRELLGSADLRELLDMQSVESVAATIGRHEYEIRDADDVHDMLRNLGDLTTEELDTRCSDSSRSFLAGWLKSLVQSRRVIIVRVAGEERLIAAEDAGRYRDALGVVPPIGLPAAFLEPIDDALADLVARFARTHVPFTVNEVAQKFGLGVGPVISILKDLVAKQRLLEGEFLPGGRGREYCDAKVLRMIKRRALARLREQVEPVEQHVLARFLPHWQGVSQSRRGLDALLDVIEQLSGVPLPASVLEREILPARVVDYQPSNLDELCLAGEVIWRGFGGIGTSDGRIALYLTDTFPTLGVRPQRGDDSDNAGDEETRRVHDLLAANGAQLFDEIVRQLGAFSHDVRRNIWQLVWAGKVTNDTLAPLRSLFRQSRREQRSGRRRRGPAPFRSRRQERLPGSEGRWSLFSYADDTMATPTERLTAIANQLLARYGVLTRASLSRETVPGGFSTLYPILKAMEEAGRVRRGYFVEGLGGAQFAAPGAEDRLRTFRDGPTEADEVTVLAATDPANAYGVAIAWPEGDDATMRPQRAAGAQVILHNGRLVGFLGRSGHHLRMFLPETEPQRGHAVHAVVTGLVQLAERRDSVQIREVDGEAVAHSRFADRLRAIGFTSTSHGFLLRRQAAQ